MIIKLPLRPRMMRRRRNMILWSQQMTKIVRILIRPIFWTNPSQVLKVFSLILRMATLKLLRTLMMWQHQQRELEKSIIKYQALQMFKITQMCSQIEM